MHLQAFCSDNSTAVPWLVKFFRRYVCTFVSQKYFRVNLLRSPLNHDLEAGWLLASAALPAYRDSQVLASHAHVCRRRHCKKGQKWDVRERRPHVSTRWSCTTKCERRQQLMRGWGKKVTVLFLWSAHAGWKKLDNCADLSVWCKITFYLKSQFTNCWLQIQPKSTGRWGRCPSWL